MRFKFKLQKTADFFDHKETAKKMEIVKVKGHLNALEDKHRDFERENKNIFAKNSIFESVSISWLKLRHDRVEANLNSMAQLKSEIDEVSEILEHKKKELKKISQKKKALEKVREKKQAEFKLEQSRIEQKLLDDNYQILRQFKE